MRTSQRRPEPHLWSWRQRLLTSSQRAKGIRLGADRAGHSVTLRCPDVGRTVWGQCAPWAGVDVTIVLDGPQAHWLSQHLGVRRRDLRRYLVAQRGEVLHYGVVGWLEREGLVPHVESYVEMGGDMSD